MLYSAPCSASGFQSVWKTTVSGQTPFREPAALPPPAAVVSLPPVVAAPPAVVAASEPAGAEVVSLLLLLSLPQAATSSKLAIGTVSNARRFMWWYSPLWWWWVEGVGSGRTGGGVPLAHRLVAEPAEEDEHDQAEEGRQDDGGDHLGPIEALAVDVDLCADAGVALAEVEVTDDRADDGQAGGVAQPDEDRRHGRRVLELPQPGGAAGALQGEELVLALVDREEPEQGVVHDREEGDQDDHQHSAGEAEAQEPADERGQGEDRRRLQRHEVGPRRALYPASQAHRRRQPHPEDDGDDQADDRHAGGQGQRVEDGLEPPVAVVPDEEAVADHPVGRRQEEALLLGEDDLGQQVPDPDEDDEHRDRPEDLGDAVALGRSAV